MFNHGSDFTIKQHANRKYASPLYAFVRIGLVLDLWCFIITAFLSEPATKQDLFFKLVKALRTLVARGCSEERLTTGNPTADSHWGFGRWGGGEDSISEAFWSGSIFRIEAKEPFFEFGRRFRCVPRSVPCVLLVFIHSSVSLRSWRLVNLGSIRARVRGDVTAETNPNEKAAARKKPSEESVQI